MLDSPVAVIGHADICLWIAETPDFVRYGGNQKFLLSLGGRNPNLFSSASRLLMKTLTGFEANGGADLFGMTSTTVGKHLWLGLTT